MPSCMYVEEISLVTMLAAKSLAGVAPEVNLRECYCVTCMPPPSANKAAQSGSETQRRCHQNRGISGYQWAHKSIYVLQNINLKIKNCYNLNVLLLYKGKRATYLSLDKLIALLIVTVIR